MGERERECGKRVRKDRKGQFRIGSGAWIGQGRKGETSYEAWIVRREIRREELIMSFDR